MNEVIIHIFMEQAKKGKKSKKPEKRLNKNMKKDQLLKLRQNPQTKKKQRKQNTIFPFM